MKLEKKSSLRFACTSTNPCLAMNYHEKTAISIHENNALIFQKKCGLIDGVGVCTIMCMHFLRRFLLYLLRVFWLGWHVAGFTFDPRACT